MEVIRRTAMRAKEKISPSRLWKSFMSKHSFRIDHSKYTIFFFMCLQKRGGRTGAGIEENRKIQAEGGLTFLGGDYILNREMGN